MKKYAADFPAMSDAFDWPGFLPHFSSVAEDAGFMALELAQTDAGPLIAWEKTGPGPCIYLSAGIHGDEPAGPLALLALLKEGFFNTANHWLICPALNPEGLAAGIRENAKGMDLNRSYWSRCQPETKAHIHWLEGKPIPSLFISLHEDWETTGFYFYEINLQPEQREHSLAILDSVTPWLPVEQGSIIDGHDIREPGWIFHAADPDLPEGWPEAIFLAKRGCPLSFTFETPSQAALPLRISAHVAAVKVACKNSLIS